MKRPRFYILDGKRPKPATATEWITWLETAERQVARNTYPKVEVSTVFLGLDHNWSGQGKPLIFETMVFGGPHHLAGKRASTWSEAERNHKLFVRLAEAKN